MTVEFDDDVKACAALVHRADPDRFMAVMAAPVPARPLLFPLYALNVEVARAPWVTQESDDCRDAPAMVARCAAGDCRRSNLCAGTRL